ncbi:MAG: Gfo/Idh/MocA family oxidoreductase, partial [Planctomycetota bacterium]
MTKRAKRITRRRFVKSAAAAVAVPTIVPRSVFGQPDKAAPSGRITVGFIGCGKMANDYHLRDLLRFGDVQALAVCEVDRTRRKHAKRRVEDAYAKDGSYRGCNEYTDF